MSENNLCKHLVSKHIKENALSSVPSLSVAFIIYERIHKNCIIFDTATTTANNTIRTRMIHTSNTPETFF